MFFKVKKEVIEKGQSYNTRISALLAAATSPPGLYDKFFSGPNVVNDSREWVKARDKLNTKESQ